MSNSKKDLEIFFPEGKKITIAGEEFIIKPFVLRTRTKVLRILADVLMEVAKSNPNLKPADISSKSMPQMTTILINTAGDRLIDIYEIVLEKPKKWLENKVTLKDEMALIQAIMEVNDIPFLLSQVKNFTEIIKNKKAN